MYLPGNFKLFMYCCHTKSEKDIQSWNRQHILNSVNIVPQSECVSTTISSITVLRERWLSLHYFKTLRFEIWHFWKEGGRGRFRPRQSWHLLWMLHISHSFDRNQALSLWQKQLSYVEKIVVKYQWYVISINSRC